MTGGHESKWQERKTGREREERKEAARGKRFTWGHRKGEERHGRSKRWCERARGREGERGGY